MQPKQTPHVSGGAYLKDAVYGANDGIITTFAVVSGVAGAGLDVSVVILLGLANLLADGFSMAASNYLGTKSEREFVDRERQAEQKEFDDAPHEEIEEMGDILRKKGYSDEDVEMLLPIFFKNQDFWMDIMLKEELGIALGNGADSSTRSAFTTFLSFALAGFVPLVPYLIIDAGESVFTLAIIFTAATLFVVGALRSRFTGRNWFVAGLEMLVVGGIAASIAYFVGDIASRLVG